ncbi:MAG: ArsS family sensor histidine kinase [Campylobacterota bacterium]|nr:ArsS family sensor histidine kinase [Campylobacterota bacterium]
MKNISILSFLRIGFIVVFILLLLLFSWFIKIDKYKYEFEQQQRYELIANGFLSGFEYLNSAKQWDQLYDKFEVLRVKDNAVKLKVLNDAQTIFQNEYQDTRIRIFSLYSQHYIYVQQAHFNVMLKDIQKRTYSATIFLGLLILIGCILLMMYWLLVRKLRPLKNLNDRIQEFSHGDLSVQVLVDSHDEVGQIAQSFNTAGQNINQLIHSRNIFMHNMMHELKTPITKGMILSEMIETNGQKDKQLLMALFENMNELISTLANIEKISMMNQSIVKEKVSCIFMLNEVKKQLFIDDFNVQIDHCSLDFIVNQELFVIVIKNLIDNALKYSNALPIRVSCTQNTLSVKSMGDPLKNSLKYYTQPFLQEKKNSKGFGLGLYLSQEILNLHQFDLEYKHQEDWNIFTIRMPS